MKLILLTSIWVLLGNVCSIAQTDLQLRAQLASDFSNYYGEIDCTDLPTNLVGMSVYWLWIDTDGSAIRPFRLWGDQTNVMEFIPYGGVHNNPFFNFMDCADVSNDLGWGTGGPIPWLDTWLALGGGPDGMSDGVFAAGCNNMNYPFTANYGNNPTVNPFLALPFWFIEQNQGDFPLGQTMTTAAGPVSLINWEAGFPATPMNSTSSVYIAQIVTDGPMVVRVNFDYVDYGVLYEHQWINDPGLVMSFGYCFDANACNYSPDFEVVGTGYEFCEYNSCTPCGGCMDEAATNFNQYAEIDNGTCFYPSCTDPAAENYDSIAYEEDGSCIYGNGACEDAQGIATDAEPMLVGVNEGGAASDAMFCFSPEPENEIVWFSFEATNENMYVFSSPTSDGLLDLVVFDACEGTQLACAQNTSLHYLGLSALTLGQTYLVGFRGEPGLVFELSISSGIVACNDQDAINYVQIVDIDSGCLYAGCIDPMACNYDQNADVDDGSCFLEGTVLQGRVYRDYNLNNQVTSNELVANYPLTILPGNDLIYTDWLGFYYYITTDNGPFTIIAEQDLENYTPEFTETLVESVGDCTVAMNNIRLISLNDGLNYLCTYPSSHYVLCVGNNALNFNIANSGNTSFTAEVTVTVAGFLNFSFVNLPQNAQLIGDNQFIVSATINPGQSHSFNSLIELLSPAFAGVTVTYDVNILDQNNALLASESYTVPAQYFCSYDPNNKLAFPEGYAEPEFIANERITYTINFQNTGNYPAVNVLIRDTLDLDVLDLSSFEFIESSHNRFTTLSGDGVLEFSFANIYLPDSTSNEPESKGWVRFSIAPHPDLPHMTQIDNKAEIYFDINEPIITNTESRTIYLCGTEAEVSEVPEFLCAGEEALTAFLNTYLDSTLWYINGELISNTESLLLPQDAEGLISVSWTGSNPLCSATDAVSIFVEVAPELFYNEETGVLFTETAGTYQWYSSQGLIAGATESFFSPTADDNYYLIVTSENGCVYQTPALTITNVDYFDSTALVLYPNPTTGHLVIEGMNRTPCSVQVTDMRGSLLISEFATTDRHHLDISRLESGSYLIQLIDQAGQRTVRPIQKTN